ncbi:MAG: preprotein translocase subunit SecG [Christensenellales bacterium]|jgi:preprotein translocase subunit SecG
MQVLSTIITVLFLLVCIGLIALVLMQSDKSAGLSGAITGGSDTFFGKRKSKSYEGKLAFLTKIAVVSFVVLAFVLALLQ